MTMLLSYLSLHLAHGQADGIYVCDAGNFSNPPWQIVKFDPNGQNPVAFITTNLNWPQDILFLPDSNRVLISNLGTGTIDKFDATTGAYIGNFASGIAGPTRMKIGPDGLIHVLQWNGANKVLRFELDGTPLGDFTSMAMQQSIGLDWDADGNLYVSTYTGDLVRKFDASGNHIGVFVASDLVGPTNIWFAANGDLLVADYDGNAVKRFDANGAYIGTFITGLGQIEGVAFYPNGRFLLGNGTTSSVKLFEPDGTFIQDLIPSGSGGLINPNAVVIVGASVVGVNDVADHQSAFIVTPIVGDTFQWAAPGGELPATVRITTPDGKEVHRTNTNTWSAAGMPEGIYLVLAQWKDGRTATQRIVVVLK